MKEKSLNNHLNEPINEAMKKLITLCKHRGILFQNSEIYGGLANTWDYGPIGVLIKNNLKAHWWKNFVQKREDILGLDTAILSLAKIWEASGHLNSFHDELVDCKTCKQRFRVENLKINHAEGSNLNGIYLKDKNNNVLSCPECNSFDLTEKRNFHLMFKTYQGSLENKSNLVYLRPETAQGIFVNFKRIRESMRMKIPFGIAQIGKSFRNEITPSDFIFRMREFEQMEIEYFIHPEDQEKYFKEWIKDCKDWYTFLGIKEENIKIRSHSKDELAHYSLETVDLEYAFPFGWGELQGIACRGDFDLKNHQKYSGTNFEYQDLERNETYLPHVIEPSFGLDRSFLAFLLDAYNEELLQNGEQRTVLKLHPSLAAVKVAIFPLKKNNSEMVHKARKITLELREHFQVQYDDRGSIGKLYRRQDEIGTPFCITVDFDSLKEDATITIRERDSMKQKSLNKNNILSYLREQLEK